MDFSCKGGQQMTIIKCEKCGKKYAYEIWDTVYPGGKERETANCPYCGEVGYSKSKHFILQIRLRRKSG